MTKSSLTPAQRRTVEIIEVLGFGVVEGLVIRDGFPCLEAEPSVVQAIKLDSTPERSPARSDAALRLKIEFERLFDQMNQLHESVVDIEVRHSLPFRLVVKRRLVELL